MSPREYHFKTEFLKKWQNAKTYTLKVASTMPAEHFDYAPTDGTRSFREQIEHISESMIYHSGLALNIDESVDVNNSKKATLRSLKANFEKVERAIKEIADESLEEKLTFWDGPSSRRKLLSLMYDHITHHRAQAIVYLRMNNLEPPNYISW